MAAPLKYEVLPDVKTTLLAVSNINTALGGSGRVYVAEGDELDMEFPDTDADGFAARIVLIDVVNGVADMKEYLDRVRGYPFKVRADVKPVQNSDYNAKQVLELIHKLVFEALDGLSLSLGEAKQLYKINRDRSTTPMFSTNQGWKYMTAGYITVLGPTEA